MRTFLKALFVIIGISLSSPVFAAYTPIAGPTVTPQMYGGRPDNSSDNYAAFRDALSYLSTQGGGTLFIPCGIYLAYSTSFPSQQGWSVPNNVTVEGENRGCVTVKITGSSFVNGLFTSTSPNNVWFKNFTCYGNSVDGFNGSAGCLYFYAPTSSTEDMKDFGCSYLTIANFAASYWVYVRNDSSYSMGRFRCDNPVGISFSGNDPDPSSIGVPATMFGFRGELFNLGGTIQDVIIDKASADGTWIKRFADFWSGVSKGKILNSTFTNFGKNTASISGGYTILVYHDDAGNIGADVPYDMIFDNVKISDPRTNGIYVAESCSIWITNTEISGTNDSGGSLLPGAAIGLNGPCGANFISNVNLNENLKGISVLLPSSSSLNLSNSVITSSLADGAGLDIKSCQSSSCSSASSPTTKYILSNNRIVMTGTGSSAVLGMSISGQSIQPGVISVSGGFYSGAFRSFSLFDQTTGGGLISSGVSVDFATIAGGSDTAGQLFSIPATDTPVFIGNSIFDCLECGSSHGGINLTGSTNINLISNVFKNKSGSGAMLFATGARGSMSNSQFFNVGSGLLIDSTDFGVTVPTWSAQQGTFIQNVLPTGAGHLHGYTNTSSTSGTTWSED